LIALLRSRNEKLLQSNRELALRIVKLERRLKYYDETASRPSEAIEELKRDLETLTVQNRTLIGKIGAAGGKNAKLRALLHIEPGEEPQLRPPIASVITAVSRQYGIVVPDILSQRRTAEVVLPRQVAMYCAVKLTLHSLPAIGRAIGGRDHTTVLHGQRKIARLRKVDPVLDENICAIELALKAAPTPVAEAAE
jgi:chromosomal replication initiation ATPase DnaA